MIKQKIRVKQILLWSLILFLVCFALTHTCKRNHVTPSVSIDIQPIKNRVANLLNKIKTDAATIDSLTNLKRKVVTRYKTKTDSIYIAAPDTCKTYIIQIKNECLAVDSLNNKIIEAQAGTINDYSKAVGDLNLIVKIQNKQLNDSSAVITQLKKDVKKERRKGKLKAVFIGIAGALSGFGIGSLN